MQLQEICIVHNAYKNLTDIPRQGRMSEEVSAIEIHPNYADGLLKIEQNKYLIVLYWAHLAKRDLLKTIPPAAKELHGVYDSRSTGSQNPLSLCIVELIECSGSTLRVRGLDALDGSSVIDIKPYTKMDIISIP